MELSAKQIIWIISGSILVIGWLVVSFTPPSRNRTVIERLSATAMYAAILTIFVSLMLHLHAAGYVFGASAPAEDLAREYGFTAEQLAERVRAHVRGVAS